MKTTHLSGPRITIGNRSIQRCSICGEKLCDSKGQVGIVGPNGEPPEFYYWEPGRFIEVTLGNPSHWMLLPIIETGEQAPENICMDLVE